jgi:SulP family sulfate permease
MLTANVSQVLIIVVTMGAWDFVIGIFVGIVLACVNFVVQTSQKSAIRATYTGEVAGSTVRRHPVQHRFLREAGKQTHVIKLAGFLFFGTIVSVENRIRSLLEDEAFATRPIRFLVVDLRYVNGLDFSAAEAFSRINRILRKRNVHLIISGLDTNTEVGKSLHNVGLLGEENEVETFSDLNSALEYCENELLKALYHRREALTKRNAPAEFLDVPNSTSQSIPVETMFSSPRRHYLQQVATTTLEQENAVPPTRWQNFKQPLPLILQTFQDLTDKNEDFWFRILPYFQRKEYKVSTTLFKKGDRPNGFYLLEDGILRGEYDQPQGKYYESIVAGTTCGELPFFSATRRTATVSAERDSVAWQMNNENWTELQRKEPEVAQELLRISLKLTSERMSSITSYVLTTAG